MTEFFEEIQEGSDIEIEEDDEDNQISPTETNSGTALISLDSTSTGSPTIGHCDVRASIDSFGIVISVPHNDKDPFPFLELPLVIREKIYQCLLVVPALVSVRQNNMSFKDDPHAPLVAERRELLPGISFAVIQVAVNGTKVPLSRFGRANVNILYANKEIYTEAKPVLYSKNQFEVVKPTEELTPSPDFSIKLFPAGCQRLVTKLNICIRSFYDLHWLFDGGYNTMKNYYRGLDTLTLILELVSTRKGFGRQWSKNEGEESDAYVQRLRTMLGHELYGTAEGHKKIIPYWMNLRVLFDGETYMDTLDIFSSRVADVERQGRQDIKRALLEAWEYFKKGGH